MIEFERKERTNILPLRWFGNGCEPIGQFFLNRYLDADYNGRDWILPFYKKMFHAFYIPSYKWGTYYTGIFEKND